MKIYRVSYYDQQESSVGFSFHSSKKEANERRMEFVRNGTRIINGEPFHDAHPDSDRTQIDEIKVPLTKSGVLAALNSYASHNDNG